MLGRRTYTYRGRYCSRGIGLAFYGLIPSVMVEQMRRTLPRRYRGIRSSSKAGVCITAVGMLLASCNSGGMPYLAIDLPGSSCDPLPVGSQSAVSVGFYGLHKPFKLTWYVDHVPDTTDPWSEKRLPPSEGLGPGPETLATLHFVPTDLDEVISVYLVESTSPPETVSSDVVGPSYPCRITPRDT